MQPRGKDPAQQRAAVAGEASRTSWKVGSVVAGKYLLQEHLARGGFTDVYRGEHVFTGQRVAVKILQAHLVGVRGLAERMQNEAMVSARVGHPNHALIFDADIVDGRVYIVMELLEGRDGRRLLVDEGPLAIERARYIISEVADGIIGAHQFGITHRDLKPENIFLTFSNIVKVLDFGTAKIKNIGPRLTEDGRVQGTLPYMSPEQRAGEDVDARTDVFALGVILYELLLGRHPFAIGPVEWPSEPELRQQMDEWRIEPLPRLRPEVPESLWRIIDKATQKNRNLRHSTVEAFKSELDEQGRFAGALGGVGTSVGRVGDDSGVMRATSVVSTAGGLGSNASPSSHASVSRIADMTSLAGPRSPEPETAPEVPAIRRARFAQEKVSKVEIPGERRPVQAVIPVASGYIRRIPVSPLLASAIGFGAVLGAASILWVALSGKTVATRNEIPIADHPSARPELIAAVPVAIPEPIAVPPNEERVVVPIAAASAVASASSAGLTPSAHPVASSQPRPARSRLSVPDALVVPDFIKEAQAAKKRSTPTPTSAPAF